MVIGFETCIRLELDRVSYQCLRVIASDNCCFVISCSRDSQRFGTALDADRVMLA